MTEDNNFGGGWLFLILVLLLAGGGFGFGGNNTAAIDNGFLNQNLNAIALSSANNNYETARLISEQNLLNMQTQNTNLLTAVNGFNAINQNLFNQTSQISQAIADLGYRMDKCCCEIKTQMLQDKYENLQNAYNLVQTDASNSRQSEFLLNTMGKWQANPSATA